MASSERFTIPVLTPLIRDEVGAPAILLVEFDPDSQWFSVATTITARWLESGNRAIYVAIARPREEVIRALAKLGVDASASEEAGMLRVDDMYSASLSREQATATAIEAIEDKYLRYGSLKVADLSVELLKGLRGRPGSSLSKWSTQPLGQLGVMLIWESSSVVLRFNEEKAYLDFVQSRALPLQRQLGRIILYAIVRGVHSESFYKQYESMVDGVIDVRVMEHEGEPKNYLRVRSLRGQRHDARWHEIEIKENGEAKLRP